MNFSLTKWISQRQILSLVAALMAVTIAQPAAAEYPDKPITLLIAFKAGGGTDTLGRIVGKAIGKVLGQPIVAVNKAGGGGAVMATALKNAAPDGYTIGLGVNVAYTFNPEYSKETPYRSTDFTHLAAIAKLQEAWVALANRPWKGWKEMIAHAKEGNPISMVSPLPATLLASKIISAREGIVIKPVPAKGGAEMIPLILGGHADFGFSGGIHQRYLAEGEKQMQVVASARSERLVKSPDVPTLAELGYDIKIDNSFIISAPKGIPADVLKVLEPALKTALQDPDVAKLIAKFGMILQYMGPAELEKFMAASSAAMRQLVVSGAAK